MLGLMLPLYFDEFAGRAAGVAGPHRRGGARAAPHAEPTIWSHLVSELLWSGAAALSITGLGDGLSEDAERLNRLLSEADDAAVPPSPTAVRSWSPWWPRPGTACAGPSRGQDRGPSVSAEIERRLDEMRSRLDRLGYGRRPAIAVGRGRPVPQATKYLAWGWWQMMAVVDCSGWSWKPSLTSTPMRSAPSSSTTLALSSRSGQAG